MFFCMFAGKSPAFQKNSGESGSLSSTGAPNGQQTTRRQLITPRPWQHWWNRQHILWLTCGNTAIVMEKNGQNCQQQSQSSLLLLKILCLHRFIVVQWLNSHHSCGWYAGVPHSVAVVDGVGHGIEGSGYESSNWRCKCWWKDVNRRVELQKIADIEAMWDILRYCCGKVEESSAPTSPRMKHLCITARKTNRIRIDGF